MNRLFLSALALSLPIAALAHPSSLFLSRNKIQTATKQTADAPAKAAPADDKAAKPEDKVKVTAAPDRKTTVIQNVRVEVGNGQVLESTTVTIIDGKIFSVGVAEVPSGAEVVDGKGKTLYPGFIDAFQTRSITLPAPPTEEGRPTGLTTAPPTMWIGNRKGITAEVKAGTLLPPTFDESNFKSGFTNALLAPNRGAIRGSSALVDFLPNGAKDRILKDDVTMGMSFRLGSGAGYPTNILGGIALLRQTLADAQSVSQGADLTDGAAKKPTWMNSLDALQPAIKGDQPVLFDANIEREMNRAYRLNAEFGIKLIFVGGRDAYKITPTLLANKTPLILTIDFGIEPALTGTDNTPAEVRKERRDRWQEQVKGPEVLAKAGVPFAFSTDSGLTDFLPTLRKLVKNGLPKDAAVRGLTQNAAQILGVADQLGTIEPGKRANVVLFSTDFTDEKSEVLRVWVDGRPVYAKKEATK